MHRSGISLLLASTLAILASPLRADLPFHYCEVAIEFSLDGKPVAAPSALVEFGREAEVTIGDPDGHAWRFRILADEPTVVRRANVIPVGIALDEIAEGTAYPRASPKLGAVPGQRAEIETILGNGDGRRVHFSVVANPRSDAEVEALRSGSESGGS
jgi:hypothetical protein